MLHSHFLLYAEDEKVRVIHLPIYHPPLPAKYITFTFSLSALISKQSTFTFSFMMRKWEWCPFTIFHSRQNRSLSLSYHRHEECLKSKKIGGGVLNVVQHLHCSVPPTAEWSLSTESGGILIGRQWNFPTIINFTLLVFCAVHNSFLSYFVKFLLVQHCK